MSTVDTTTQYLVIVALTLLFSVLAILETEVNPRKIILQWIAAISWFVSGYIHFLSGDITSVFTVAPTYLFAAIGLVFTLSALYSISEMGIRKGAP